MVTPTRTWSSAILQTPIPISFSASGDNIIVAAVSGKIIRLYRLLLVVGAATSITFFDGTPGGTALSGAFPFSAGGSMVLDDSGDAWYMTSPGNALVLNNLNAVQVSGTAWYIQQ
jgi:hypothetical protein